MVCNFKIFVLLTTLNLAIFEKQFCMRGMETESSLRPRECQRGCGKSPTDAPRGCVVLLENLHAFVSLHGYSGILEAENFMKKINLLSP